MLKRQQDTFQTIETIDTMFQRQKSCIHSLFDYFRQSLHKPCVSDPLPQYSKSHQRWNKSVISAWKHKGALNSWRYTGVTTIARISFYFFCFDCEKSLLQFCHLKIHIMSHTSEKEHECLQCGKAFRLFHDLQKHQMSHTGEKTFECSLCGKSLCSCVT